MTDLNPRVARAGELLGSLYLGEPVTLTWAGQSRRMVVTRRLWRLFGDATPPERERVTFADRDGPAAFTRSVTAEQIAAGDVRLRRQP